MRLQNIKCEYDKLLVEIGNRQRATENPE